MIRRSSSNLPLWAEFTLLTFAVTSLCMVLGLVIRGFVGAEARSANSVRLMKVETSPFARSADHDGNPVVQSLRAPALPPEAALPQTGASARPTQPQQAITFDGKRLRPVRTMSMLVTAYSPDERSCGKWADGQTASGYSVWTNGMKLVAADTRLLPFGTIVTIPGYNGGRPVQVLDRGGKIKGHRLDVLYPTHEIARRWGAQHLTVTVWEYAE